MMNVTAIQTIQAPVQTRPAGNTGIVPPWLGDPRDLVPLPGPVEDEFVILPIDEDLLPYAG